MDQLRDDNPQNSPPLVPLAIFFSCVVISVAIYLSGGIHLGTGQAEDNQSSDLPSEEEAVYDETVLEGFAKCLAEKGVTLYAASFCGHCTTQKGMFGEALQYLNQVECADEVTGGWSDACSDGGIKAVPTWITSDGSQLVGLQSLENLAEKTDCPLE